MFEPKFIDEEKIPLLNDDVDDSVGEDSQAETSFNNDDDEQAETSFDDDMQEEAQKLNTEINALERGFNVKIPPEERGRFRRSSGYLQVEKSREYVSVTKSNGELLAASTLRTRLGASLARSLLGIETPTSARVQFRALFQDIPTKIETNELTPMQLKEAIEGLTRSIGTNTDLDMCEFPEIDKALTRISGELANNVGELMKSTSTSEESTQS